MLEPLEPAIAEHVRDGYGLTVTDVCRVLAGADARAATYRLATATGRYFLKLRRGSMDVPNAALVRFLADAVPAVVSPLRARDGELVTRFDGYSVLLYPYVDGRNGFDIELTERQWMSLGTTLRAVHGLELPAALRDATRREDFASTWRERARRHLARRRGLRPVDGVAAELLRLLDVHEEHIRVIVDRAERLATVLRAEDSPMVLCHGDLHAGNVLVEDGDDSPVFVVDWDDPVVAPKERDLMFIGGGVGGVWGSAADTGGFYRGYGSTTIDRAAMAYYRYERIAADVADFCDQLLPSAAGSADRALSRRYFADQFSPGNVVELADETYARLTSY